MPEKIETVIEKILIDRQRRKLISEKEGFTGNEKFNIERMRGDGSSRHFYRVFAPGTSFLAIYAPPGDLSTVNENDSYYYIGTHLKERGIPVPEIYAYDRRKGIILLEDLGNTHLQSVVDFQHRCEESKARYEKILSVLIKMQVEGARSFDSSQCFDTPVYDRDFIYRRELLYFEREFLKRYLGLNTKKLNIEKELQQLAELVSCIPNSFFMHRDFQSRNIMVKGSKFYFIDFQGGRFGPPTYDLASFLIDPYVNMPPEIQENLKDAYFSEMQTHVKISKDEFERHYQLTALCRNLQILAAFVFLSQLKNKPIFARYIRPALYQLHHTINSIDNRPFETLRSIILENTRPLS